MEPYINTPQLEAPGIPGLKLRPFHGEADFSNIASVINASFAADRKRERISVDELVNMYTNPIHWNPKQDTLLAEVDERLAGCEPVARGLGRLPNSRRRDQCHP